MSGHSSGLTHPQRLCAPAVKKITMSILIKNGRVVTATDDYIADIFIEGETVSAIGKNLSVKADKEIDAAGKLVMPGGIDPHVHLDMPFMGTFSSDNYETGTRAALYGGTTMVIDFILQKQVVGDPVHRVAALARDPAAPRTPSLSALTS